MVSGKVEASEQDIARHLGTVHSRISIATVAVADIFDDLIIGAIKIRAV